MHRRPAPRFPMSGLGALLTLSSTISLIVARDAGNSSGLNSVAVAAAKYPEPISQIRSPRSRGDRG